MSDVHWCECGQPWKPAAGLYGTTEETACQACRLRRALHTERVAHVRTTTKLLAEIKNTERLGELFDRLYECAVEWHDQGHRSKWTTRQSLALWDHVRDLQASERGQRIVR